MLGSVIIVCAIALVTSLLFVGMFTRLGRGWNGGLGNEAYKRRR
jgi:hypothetical protein